MNEAREKLQAAIDKLGLTVDAKFVPFRMSRNKTEKMKSLNWVVTLSVKGVPFLMTDYMAGQGHCPAYKASIAKLGGRDCIMRASAISEECEHGTEHGISRKPILPDVVDVIYSLSMDADVLNSPTYEDWAGDFGFDVDSRKGEKIYRECLEHALKLRAAIGETGLAELREAAQDY